MGKPTELMQLLKTGNSDAARKLIAKMKKSGRSALLIASCYIEYLFLSYHLFAHNFYQETVFE